MSAGPIALVGSGEYLPIMQEVEAQLIAGRNPKYVQIPTAAAPEGESSLHHWITLGKAQADRIGVEAVSVIAHDRNDAQDPRIAELVRAAGLIYLSGGNPTFLANTLRDTLRIFADMVPHIQVKADVMRAAALQGFATATDLADYLVKKGMPFRDAHEAVANAVKVCASKGVDLAELNLVELRLACALSNPDMIGSDITAVLTLQGSVNSRNHVGGTAPERVLAAITQARSLLKD